MIDSSANVRMCLLRGIRFAKGTIYEAAPKQCNGNWELGRPPLPFYGVAVFCCTPPEDWE